MQFKNHRKWCRKADFNAGDAKIADIDYNTIILLVSLGLIS